MKRIYLLFIILFYFSSCQTKSDKLLPEANGDINYANAISKVGFEKTYLVFKNQEHFDLVINKLIDQSFDFSFNSSFSEFKSFEDAINLYDNGKIELLLNQPELIEKSDLFVLLEESDGSKSLEYQIAHPPLRKVTNNRGFVKIGDSLIKLTYDNILNFGDGNSTNPIEKVEIIHREINLNEKARGVAGSVSDTKEYNHSGKKYRFKSKITWDDYYFFGQYGRTYLSFETKHQKRHVGFIWAQFNTSLVKINGSAYNYDSNSWIPINVNNSNSSYAGYSFGSVCNYFPGAGTVCTGVYGQFSTTQGGTGLNGGNYESYF